MSQIPKVGYCCAYAPRPLIDAAGFVPYRILPKTEVPDQAGRLLHDNICPHVKRILDRAMGDDLPELAGLCVMNSCDAMRRMAEVWKRRWPERKTLLVDLPIGRDERSFEFFTSELKRFAGSIFEWKGFDIDEDKIRQAISRHNRLVDLVEQLRESLKAGTLPGGGAKMQALYNEFASMPVADAIDKARSMINQDKDENGSSSLVPIYVLGNVLPDPEAFSLIESCGARIVADDLCTGSRQFIKIDESENESPYLSMARSLLVQSSCARTFDVPSPGSLARRLIEDAKASGAKGVIGHTVKFCDPYLGRLPHIRDAFKQAKLPLLILEGDCTLRSIGQQRTRIEAFIEMLECAP